MSAPGTPEAGYSTVDPSALRALLSARKQSEERQLQTDHVKALFDAAISKAEQDVIVSSWSHLKISIILFILFLLFLL